MNNLVNKRKVMMYIAIAVLIILIISVIYFMINSKIKEKEFNSDMQKSLINIADSVVYDYNYSVENNIKGNVLMKFDIKDKTVVEKVKGDTQLQDGMLLVKYDGKNKITVNLPSPIITNHEIKGDDLKKEDVIETNKAVNAAKIEIENKVMSTDAAQKLTDRFKTVLYEFLRAKGYKEIDFK